MMDFETVEAAEYLEANFLPHMQLDLQQTSLCSLDETNICRRIRHRAADRRSLFARTRTAVSDLARALHQ